MAQLYTLLFGSSKSRMKPIMVDLENKCRNYRDSRVATKGSKASAGHYDIVPAESGAKVWRKSNSNQWTGYNSCEPTFSKQPRTKRKRG